MLTQNRIKQVMHEKRCDYSAACSWLGKRAAEAKAGRKRAADRRAELLKRSRAQMVAMGTD